MRCLLLHPEDDPLAGTWARGGWDRVVDLGIAGPGTYKTWRDVLGCDVEPYPSLGPDDFRQLRAMYNFGLGQVVDAHGLDWWDLTWLRWLDRVIEFLPTAKFVSGVGPSDEIFVSSGGRSRRFDVLAPGRVRQIRTEGRTHPGRFQRLRRLRFSQVLEVLGDKYDGDYNWRRRFASPPANCSRPVVLLPSAYGNASRTAYAMAADLPECNFLLVGTRRSAWVSPVPTNVKRAWLSSYAVGADDREIQSLLALWEKLRKNLGEHAELSLLRDSGCFESFAHYLREGLAIRNCWASVIDREPVASVLCADEKNAYTKIPILLARNSGIPTLACHHGALDGRYRFTDVCADRFLAKSEMEWDYMVQTCKVPEEKVRVNPGLRPTAETSVSREGRNAIVFFSEPYEVSNGRAHAVYCEVLPSLIRVAREHAREVVIKLHPFESLRERKQLVGRILGDDERSLVHFIAGPISNELLETAWCSVTVSSSAAVECSTRGIPSFLCLWLDRYGYRYGEQFVKFGAAMPLRQAEDIALIPELLEHGTGVGIGNFSPRVPPEFLRELLFPDEVAAHVADSEAQQERLWA